MTGTLSAVGRSGIIRVMPGRSFTYDISSVHEFIGTVVLRRSAKGVDWEPIVTGVGTVAVPLTSTIASGTITNEGSAPAFYDVAVLVYNVASDAITYTVTPVAFTTVALEAFFSAASTLALSASSTTQTCTITLKNTAGTTIAAAQAVRVWLSSDATGVTLASAANGTVAPTTGTILKLHTAKLDWDLLSDVNGVIVLSIANAGGTDHYAVYVNLRLPSGRVLTSAVTDVRSA